LSYLREHILLRKLAPLENRDRRHPYKLMPRKSHRLAGGNPEEDFCQGHEDNRHVKGHYVFDLWVEVWRKKVAKGDVVVVRYADDRVPRTRKGRKGPQCVTALPMREGPSGPACRSRFQTTSGGCGQKPWS